MTPVAHLSRRYHISASHRLHTSRIDAAANRATFGKCNNPYGHGHNYAITITVSGPIDPATGMVTNLADLDRFAEEHLLRAFDHQNLNMLPAFEDIVPTTENLTLAVHRIFRQYSHARLTEVHIDETPRNSFTYSAGDNS